MENRKLTEKPLCIEEKREKSRKCTVLKLKESWEGRHEQRFGMRTPLS